MDQNGRSDWYDDYAEDKDAEDKDELQIAAAIVGTL